jgi:hypothetical protein
MHFLRDTKTAGDQTAGDRELLPQRAGRLMLDELGVRPGHSLVRKMTFERHRAGCTTRRVIVRVNGNF